MGLEPELHFLIPDYTTSLTQILLYIPLGTVSGNANPKEFGEAVNKRPQAKGAGGGLFSQVMELPGIGADMDNQLSHPTG